MHQLLAAAAHLSPALGQQLLIAAQCQQCGSHWSLCLQGQQQQQQQQQQDV
jgi:hypothetical protein